ncbi:chemotaxis protein CheA [Natroniella sulfidigena]|uniref:chemotaxis protein CheA n=1 Tax=Natroniella sulfidigena TaxID=723921 RepID=UPI00200AA521|nr:chemotaxis protein CheA [Natroniella sulfidigena]MCK8816824.1 chemotaxis protein CheA [Natroniella sulfidigena]
MNQDLIQTFIEETEENLQVVEESLLDLEQAPADQELIDLVFRAMHSIKGGAGLVGFEEIGELAHYLENILEEIRQAANPKLPDDIFNLLFAGIDLIRQMIEDNDLTAKSVGRELTELKKAIKHYQLVTQEGSSDEQTIQQQTGQKYYKINLKFRETIFETGTDPLMLVLELEEVGTILASYLNREQVDDLFHLNPHLLLMNWTIFLESEQSLDKIEDIFIFVKEDNQIVIEEISEELEQWFSGGEETEKLLRKEEFISNVDLDQVLAKQEQIGESLFLQSKTTKEETGQADKQVRNLHKQKRTETIRVATDKLEGILNDIAELLIAQSRVKELATGIVGLDRSLQSEIVNSFQEVDKLIRRVQEEVMSASMIPIGDTFTRLKRMVRDIAAEKEKDVKLVISGEDTELDRKIIEQLADPLKHLVRNAVDHGVERPEQREKLGKPPTGTIELDAYHQEGSIIIEIVDDGRGIDKEAVLAKAKEKGMIEQESQLDDSEIYNLLFKPGFSTAQEVTDISGRGVGLDVVMSNIKDIRGNVEVFSEKNQGTKIKIKLPLTLAIIDGMIVRVGGERVVIPLNSIVEFIDASKQQIKQVEGKGLIVSIREQYIPCMALNELLQLEGSFNNLKEEPTGVLIILKDDQKQIAVQIDEVIGQEQVVIKNVKENMGQAEGIAGATILGDGNVALILDVPTLFKLAKRLKVG